MKNLEIFILQQYKIASDPPKLAALSSHLFSHNIGLTPAKIHLFQTSQMKEATLILETLTFQ